MGPLAPFPSKTQANRCPSAGWDPQRHKLDAAGTWDRNTNEPKSHTGIFHTSTYCNSHQGNQGNRTTYRTRGTLRIKENN